MIASTFHSRAHPDRLRTSPLRVKCPGCGTAGLLGIHKPGSPLDCPRCGTTFGIEGDEPWRRQPAGDGGAAARPPQPAGDCAPVGLQAALAAAAVAIPVAAVGLLVYMLGRL